MIENFKIFKVNCENLFDYSHIIPDYYIKKYNDSKKTICLILNYENKDIGYVLCEVYQKKSGAFLRRVFIHKDYRRNSYGTILINNLKDILLQKNVNKLITRFFKEDVHSKSLDFLDKNGFSNEFFNIVCKFNKKSFVAPVVRFTRIPKHFEIFKWNEITNDIKEQIKTDPLRSEYEKMELYPLKEKSYYKIAYENSLGLLYKGNIAGWMITKWINDKELLYSNLYVKPQFRKSGVGIALLNNSIAMRPVDEGFFTVPSELEDHIQFVKRRMGPYLTYTKHQYYSESFVS